MARNLRNLFGLLKPRDSRSLEDRLGEELSSELSRLEDYYQHKFAWDQRAETLQVYFTDTIPQHSQPEKAVRQYRKYLGEFLRESWGGEDFRAEGKEVVQLFFAQFPAVQSYLPLRWSEQWASDRLAAYHTYVQHRENPPEGWNQAGEYQVVKDSFTDTALLEGLSQQHQSRQAKWRRVKRCALAGLVIAAVGGAVGVGAWYVNRLRNENTSWREYSEDLASISANLRRERDELNAAQERLKAYNTTLLSEKGSLADTVKDLTAERDALNQPYLTLSSALATAATTGDAGAVRAIVCAHLARSNGDVVLRDNPSNPARGLLFDSIVGGAAGRDRADYEAARDVFTQLSGVFHDGALGEEYSGHVQFTNEGCP